MYPKRAPRPSEFTVSATPRPDAAKASEELQRVSIDLVERLGQVARDYDVVITVSVAPIGSDE